jgi:hypothetical protein
MDHGVLTSGSGADAQVAKPLKLPLLADRCGYNAFSGAMRALGLHF